MVDKNGVEIKEGCFIKYKDGTIERIYMTSDGLLGTDATNKSWLESGRAVPCEYGVYPLSEAEAKNVEVVEIDKE